MTTPLWMWCEGCRAPTGGSNECQDCGGPVRAPQGNELVEFVSMDGFVVCMDEGDPVHVDDLPGHIERCHACAGRSVPVPCPPLPEWFDGQH